jgi:hypothetical protein
MRKWLKVFIVFIITTGIITGGFFRIVPAVRDCFEQRSKKKDRELIY